MFDLSVRALLVGVVLVSTAATASAQGAALGRSGDFAIGAERLFGFLSTAYSTDEGMAESTVTATEITLLSSGGSSPYAAPRVGFDAFVADNISVGGVLGLANVSSEIESSSGGASMTVEAPSATAITVGARGGYLFTLNETLGLWPHVGVTYYTVSSDFGEDDDSEVSAGGLAVSADALFVVMPAPHFGISIGPILDVGLSGTTEVTTPAPMGTASTESDMTVTDIGVQAGLFGWL